MRLYFLPGDSLIMCFIGTFIGEFYEFQLSDRGGVFSFFVPWFLLSILMVSIDDTDPKEIVLFKKRKERKKILTKEGKKGLTNALIILLISVSLYISLFLIGIEYIWLNLLLLIVFLFLSWYAIFTGGYSIQRKKFKKGKKILTVHGAKLLLKLLVIVSTLLILYFISSLFNHSCLVILFFIVVSIITFYLSIGDRWLKLKNEISELYIKVISYFKK
ncbi:MAG: hypothetical protein ISR69_05905 [Gammaproteobacteria bacterium]|nr:hypothetical protein [Gammaproteobacteria bacterium]